jgi:hypothetical protein
VEIHLAARANRVAENRAPYRVKQISMGKPRVDLNNRDAVYRAMEE